MTQPPPSRRCAIYTRKSSEEGLDQSFNSLHAQREACEAYVMSQAGEGWRIIPTIYDDPGYSGGSMDRPALQQLMRDVAHGHIDTVVVYKVDRLTRSLADFAKIVEAFDQHQVTFVSVTQAFNTTTSMGRLTLNVLLSFAQFEREVTGERIRDKIAASKAKGMWMGGNPPLGYDPKDRTLVVNKREAAQVRQIFERYLELGSVHALEAELRAQDVRSKRWLTRKGEARGGERFSRGALYHLLKNPVYLGRIPHKSQSYPGQHPPIIDRVLFDQVQAKLTENRVAHKHRPLKGSACLLKGRIFNDAGEPMSPAIAYGKGGSAYRYYVAASAQQGRSTAASIRRVSAPATEAWLKEQLGRVLGPDHTGLERVQRVSLLAEAVTIDLLLDGLDGEELMSFGRGRLEDGERLTWIRSPELARLSVPARLQLRGGRTSIDLALPRRGGPDPTLLKALRKGHALLKQAGASPLASMRRQSASRAISDPYEQALTRLAFLAPEVQRLIGRSRGPASMSLARLLKGPIPLLWADQLRLFGLAAACAETRSPEIEPRARPSVRT